MMQASFSDEDEVSFWMTLDGAEETVGLIWGYFVVPWFMNKSVYSQNLQTVVASVLERCFGVQCTNTPQDKMPASPFDKGLYEMCASITLL